MTSIIKKLQKDNLFLPKYKKQWTKERSLDAIVNEDGGTYLVLKAIENKDYNILRGLAIEQKEGMELYFFELFKNLIKYKNLRINLPHNLSIENKRTLEDIQSELKKYLLIKFITKFKYLPLLSKMKESKFII